MKRLILFLLFAAILVSCSTNNNSPFTINGTVKGLDSAKVVLIKFVVTLVSNHRIIIGSL